jgi:basic amino acid/polyamine antiporter, APA family
MPAGWRGTFESAAVLFFAYTGYARIATLAEEVREPRRTIPRAVLITLAGAIALYLAVALVAVGAAGAEALGTGTAPLHRAALGFSLPWVATAVAIGGVIAMLGVVLSQLLGLSRMGFAMARKGDLPPFLAAVHPRWGVPGRAVLAIGAVAAVIAATGTLRGVTAIAAFSILVYYGIANVAALRMPSEAKLYPDAVPALGAVACTVLAFSLSWRVIAAGAAALAAGLVARAALRALTRPST